MVVFHLLLDDNGQMTITLDGHGIIMTKSVVPIRTIEGQKYVVQFPRVPSWQQDWLKHAQQARRGETFRSSLLGRSIYLEYVEGEFILYSWGNRFYLSGTEEQRKEVALFLEQVHSVKNKYPRYIPPVVDSLSDASADESSASDSEN
jgi:hypothetical protein